MDIKLQPLSEELIETLRQWRNENRKYFVSQEIITPEMQKKWYEKYRKNPDDTIYIVFYQGKPVGALATIIRGEDIEIGRFMLGRKEHARKGIIGEALELVLAKFANKRIFLEVLKDNTIAVCFYRKHKFTIVGESESNNTYIMERMV